jgi:hypothetical protein
MTIYKYANIKIVACLWLRSIILYKMPKYKNLFEALMVDRNVSLVFIYLLWTYYYNNIVLILLIKTPYLLYSDIV